MSNDDTNTNVLDRLLGKRLAAILLPAIIFQSIGMGGGFTTGREIVEYHGQFGAYGLLSMLAFGIVLTLGGVAIYEFARIHKSYEYKDFIWNLIGGFWPLFEIVYATLAIIVIAVVVDAGGNVVASVLGIPSFISNIALILLIAGILYFGQNAVEAVGIYGTILLYVTFVLMFSLVISQRLDQAIGVIMSGNTAYASDASISDAIQSGLLYGAFALPFYIPVLFTIERIKSWKEAALSGILSAVMIMVPLALAYLSLMGFYPDEAVIGAPVPWLAMLEQIGGVFIVGIYGVALGWTLIETGVGFVHSITDRISQSIRESDNAYFSDKSGLSNIHRGAISVIILVGAALLSRFGIIALVAQGYVTLSYLFVLLLGVPLIIFAARQKLSKNTVVDTSD